MDSLTVQQVSGFDIYSPHPQNKSPKSSFKSWIKDPEQDLSKRVTSIRRRRPFQNLNSSINASMSSTQSGHSSIIGRNFSTPGKLTKKTLTNSFISTPRQHLSQKKGSPWFRLRNAVLSPVLGSDSSSSKSVSDDERGDSSSPPRVNVPKGPFNTPKTNPAFTTPAPNSSTRRVFAATQSGRPILLFTPAGVATDPFSAETGSGGITRLRKRMRHENFSPIPGSGGRNRTSLFSPGPATVEQSANLSQFFPAKTSPSSGIVADVFPWMTKAQRQSASGIHHKPFHFGSHFGSPSTLFELATGTSVAPPSVWNKPGVFQTLNQQPASQSLVKVEEVITIPYTRPISRMYDQKIWVKAILDPTSIDHRLIRTELAHANIHAGMTESVGINVTKKILRKHNMDTTSFATKNLLNNVVNSLNSIEKWRNIFSKKALLNKGDGPKQSRSIQALKVLKDTKTKPLILKAEEALSDFYLVVFKGSVYTVKKNNESTIQKYEIPALNNIPEDVGSITKALRGEINKALRVIQEKLKQSNSNNTTKAKPEEPNKNTPIFATCDSYIEKKSIRPSTAETAWIDTPQQLARLLIHLHSTNMPEEAFLDNGQLNHSHPSVIANDGLWLKLFGPNNKYDMDVIVQYWEAELEKDKSYTPYNDSLFAKNFDSSNMAKEKNKFIDQLLSVHWKSYRIHRSIQDFTLSLNRTELPAFGEDINADKKRNLHGAIHSPFHTYADQSKNSKFSGKIEKAKSIINVTNFINKMSNNGFIDYSTIDKCKPTLFKKSDSSNPSFTETIENIEASIVNNHGIISQSNINELFKVIIGKYRKYNGRHSLSIIIHRLLRHIERKRIQLKFNGNKRQSKFLKRLKISVRTRFLKPNGKESTIGYIGSGDTPQTKTFYYYPNLFSDKPLVKLESGYMFKGSITDHRLDEGELSKDGNIFNVNKNKYVVQSIDVQQEPEKTDEATGSKDKKTENQALFTVEGASFTPHPDKGLVLESTQESMKISTTSEDGSALIAKGKWERKGNNPYYTLESGRFISELPAEQNKSIEHESNKHDKSIYKHKKEHEPKNSYSLQFDVEDDTFYLNANDEVEWTLIEKSKSATRKRRFRPSTSHNTKQLSPCAVTTYSPKTGDSIAQYKGQFDSYIPNGEGTYSLAPSMSHAPKTSDSTDSKTGSAPNAPISIDPDTIVGHWNWSCLNTQTDLALTLHDSNTNAMSTYTGQTICGLFEGTGKLSTPNQIDFRSSHWSSGIVTGDVIIQNTPASTTEPSTSSAPTGASTPRRKPKENTTYNGKVVNNIRHGISTLHKTRIIASTTSSEPGTTSAFHITSYFGTEASRRAIAATTPVK